MAADDARAQRIRETWLERKAENPRKFTWGRIASYVGTTERAAQDWQKTGGIDYDNARKLAKYLEVDFDWLWRGDPEEKPSDTPDLFAGSGDRLAQLERDIEQVHRKLDLLLQAAGINLRDVDVQLPEGPFDRRRHDEGQRQTS